MLRLNALPVMAVVVIVMHVPDPGRVFDQVRILGIIQPN
jgi:hypothetical protein